MRNKTIFQNIKFRSNAKAVNKDVNKMGTSLKKVSGQSKGIGALGGAFGGLGKMVRGVIPALGAFKMALISTGIGAIVVAIGSLIAGMVSLVKNSIEFEKAQSKLTAVLGKNNVHLEKLKQQAKDLGASTAFTATQVAQLQVELAKLGFQGNQIQNMTAGILDLSQALGSELAPTSELVGSVLNTFGLESTQTTEVVDTLAKASTTTSLNFERLQEGLAKVGATASAIGLSLQDTTAMLGLLTDSGLSASVAGTGMRRVFMELAKSGMTLDEAVLNVQQSSNGLGEAMDSVGAVGATTLLIFAQQSERLGELTEEINHFQGTASEMSEIMTDNLEGDFTRLSSAFDGLMLSFEDGDGPLNQLTRVITQGLTKSINGLTKVVKSINVLWTAFREQLSISGDKFKLFGARMAINIGKMKMAWYSLPFVGDEAKKESSRIAVEFLEQEYDKLATSIEERSKNLATKTSMELTKVWTSLSPQEQAKEGANQYNKFADEVKTINDQLNEDLKATDEKDFNKRIKLRKDAFQDITDAQQNFAGKLKELNDGVLDTESEAYKLSTDLLQKESKKTDNIVQGIENERDAYYKKLRQGRLAQQQRDLDFEFTQKKDALERELKTEEDLEVRRDKRIALIDEEIDAQIKLANQIEDDGERRKRIQTLEGQRKMRIHKATEKYLDDEEKKTKELEKVEDDRIKKRDSQLEALEKKIDESLTTELDRINTEEEQYMAMLQEKMLGDEAYEAKKQELQEYYAGLRLEATKNQAKQELHARNEVIQGYANATNAIVELINQQSGFEVDRLDEQQQRIDQEYGYRISQAGENADEVVRLEKERDQALQQIEREKAIREARQLQRQQAMALVQLGIDAQLALSKMAIDNAQAGSSVASGFANTIKAGFPQNIPLLIAYGVQATGILLSMKRAREQAKSIIGANSPTSGAGGGGEVSAPTIPTISNIELPQQDLIDSQANVFSQQNQQPTRAYVLASDVRNGMEANNQIKQRRTL